MIGRLRDFLEERRAAADAVRMFSGSLSSEEEKRLAGWSKEDSSYSRALRDTAQAMAELEGLVDDPLLMSVVDSGEQAEPVAEVVAHPARKRRMGYAIAASVLIAVFVGVGVYSNQPSEEDSRNILRYVTRVGEQKTVDLEDGSQITLNTATELLVDISEHSRHLMLKRGEAFFEVAKDTSRPFSVEVGSRSVTALGTAFNIHRLPESFTLAVTEGVVSIHQKEDPVLPAAPMLSAPEGEEVALNNPGQVRVQAGTVAEYNAEARQLVAFNPEDIVQFQSWRGRIIRFDSVPLYQVVKELNRYSAKKILIEDTAIMDLELYSTVHIDHMNEALSTFERALPIKVMHRFDRIVIVGRK